MAKRVTAENKVQVPWNFIPRRYQLHLFQNMDGIAGQPETRKKRALLRWHRRAGKDLTCFCYMVKEAMSRRGIYYYFLPNYQQGRKIIWEGIDKGGVKFLDRLPKEYIKRIQNQEMIIETINGSVIRVIGTDNIDSIVGTNPVGNVFSEYALQNPQAWEFIRPIVAENDGWAIFNGTPRGRNHMYDLEMKIQGHKDWYLSIAQTLWPERPYYTGVVKEHTIQGERDSGMEEDMIEQEFGVSYSAGLKGSFYSDLIDKARMEDRIGHYGYDNYKLVDTFWDLGVDDSTAVWFRQLDGSRRVWIDYYENSGKDVAYYVKMLADKGYQYRTHYLPHDGGSRSLQTQFRTDDIFRMLCKEYELSDDVVVCPRLPVQDGINAILLLSVLL